MRAEIDALVARAYGLTEDELSFIFKDFTENAVTPVYRRLVLEKFKVAEAAKWAWRYGRQRAGYGEHPAPPERAYLMILVDTSVWIDHLRNPEPALQEQLKANNVLVHPIVVGELACGNLPERPTFLAEYGCNA